MPHSTFENMDSGAQTQDLVFVKQGLDWLDYLPGPSLLDPDASSPVWGFGYVSAELDKDNPPLSLKSLLFLLWDFAFFLKNVGRERV